MTKKSHLSSLLSEHTSEQTQAFSGNLPLTPDEITIDWLDHVFQTSGVPYHDELVSVEVIPTAVGFGAIGNSARLALRYSCPHPDAPVSLFAKFSSGHPMSDLVSKWEVLFYRRIGPEVSLRIPDCYFGATDPERGHSLLLLEDLTEGRTGDSVAGCETHEAELVLRQIASFHAEWWESAELSNWPWLHRTSAMTDEVDGGEIPDEVWGLFREKHGHLVPRWADSVVERTIRNRPEILRILKLGPRTLTHQDLQPDNIQFGLAEVPSVIFDWQLAMCGQGAMDVAFFLAFSLTVPHRRRQEERLIEVYHAALVEAGVSDYPMEALRRDMKPCFLHYFVRLVMFGAYADFSTERSKKRVAAYIERFLSIFEDHDLFEDLRDA